MANKKVNKDTVELTELETEETIDLKTSDVNNKKEFVKLIKYRTFDMNGKHVPRYLSSKELLVVDKTKESKKIQDPVTEQLYTFYNKDLISL